MAEIAERLKRKRKSRRDEVKIRRLTCRMPISD
jgi:hypothetical protein